MMDGWQKRGKGINRPEKAEYQVHAQEDANVNPWFRMLESLHVL